MARDCCNASQPCIRDRAAAAQELLEGLGLCLWTIGMTASLWTMLGGGTCTAPPSCCIPSLDSQGLAETCLQHEMLRCSSLTQ